MIAQHVGERIRLYRRQRELSQGDLARLLGVDKVSAWRWETGRATPSLRRLQAICAALEITLTQLVDDVS